MTHEKRVAVITGATSELGAVVTRCLAGQGASLALLDRNSDRLAAQAKSLGLPESLIFTRTLNLLDPAEVKSAAEAVAAKFGRIDILLHLVGGWTGGKTLVEASAEDVTFMFNQHVWTSFNVTQAFVPHLVKNGWGRVVMVSSPFAAHPVAKGGPYAIGKAGQEALVLALSKELIGTGITANLLEVKTIDAKREKVSAPTAENASWSTPEELASAILYLFSDEAGGVNGAKIPMYGSY
jgi:NAD(P)-dependent dehydrogenase (short-subunit alcohol dehydrogenase family)